MDGILQTEFTVISYFDHQTGHSAVYPSETLTSQIKAAIS